LQDPRYLQSLRKWTQDLDQSFLYRALKKVDQFQQRLSKFDLCLKYNLKESWDRGELMPAKAIPACEILLSFKVPALP
jgi:hypothetical protein